MKERYKFIYIWLFICIIFVGVYVVRGESIAHICEGQVMEYQKNPSTIRSQVVRNHKIKIGNFYSGSINIIEKYLTIFMILYILRFYVRNNRKS